MKSEASNQTKASVPIAYVSAVYPAPSETFVAREIDGLRARGWTVRTAALRQLPGAATEDAPERTLDHRLTGQAMPRTLIAALLEIVTHPFRSASTLWRATRDAAVPGEPTELRRRINVLALSAVGIGFARWCRREGVRHIHAHFANGPATVALYAAHQLGIPMSFTGHANDIFDRRSLLVRKLERASFVSCISEWHREWYVEQTGPSDRFRIIRCGVAADDAAFAQTENVPLRGPRQIMCVARMIEKKGIDTLIDALDLLDRENPGGFELSLAGDGPLRGALEEQIAELKLDDRTQLLGLISNDEVQRRLAEADYFILPCRTDRLGDKDGIPVVLMEAMLHGVPVIAGDLPAIRELVHDGETGVIVPPNDAEAVARAVRTLEAAPESREAVIKAARERVGQEFSLGRNLDRLERAIHESAGLRNAS